ncbi:MAG TPA: DUF134 domain-containing protein [Candidatus Peregrinibacteria bacterium]|nr:DUF134 domain-containing protein [Candidatus Peregrinibacteria bacterium]
MPRPKRFRRIGFSPEITFFKQQEVTMSHLEQVDICLDKLEAIRLNDYEEINMEEGAKKMKISRSTFQRLVASAHKKIADSLINGKAIMIHRQIDFNFPSEGDFLR